MEIFADVGGILNEIDIQVAIPSIAASFPIVCVLWFGSMNSRRTFILGYSFCTRYKASDGCADQTLMM